MYWDGRIQTSQVIINIRDNMSHQEGQKRISEIVSNQNIRRLFLKIPVQRNCHVWFCCERYVIKIFDQDNEIYADASYCGSHKYNDNVLLKKWQIVTNLFKFIRNIVNVSW